MSVTAHVHRLPDLILSQVLKVYMDDERIASVVAARLGFLSVACTFGDDWDGQNDRWTDGLPDLTDD